MKRTRELLDLLGIDLPIVLAPMAGNSTPELVAAVSNAGGLGSYGCAMLSREQLIEEAGRIKSLTNHSFNLNFFCHAPPNVTAEHDQAWRSKLAPYYAEFDIEPGASAGGARRPFDEETCDAVLAIGPRVVSFHFGMPKPELVQRLKAAGMVLMSSATTSTEARRLVDLGADVIVAQGLEAGGHRGMFLTSDISAQVGTMALVPQVVDAVDVPVIATGGIADARGAAAALALGADAVTPVRAEAERRGSSDFSPLWSGQAAALAREIDAAELTRNLAAGMFDVLGELGDAARKVQRGQRAPAHS